MALKMTISKALGHGLCLVKRRKHFTLCKIQSRRRNSAWGAKYPIYYLFQDKFKNPKIIKIQQVHQKLSTKMFEYLDYLFLFVIHLNFK